MLAMFLSSLNQTIVSTGMPQIVSDLGGFTRYTWVTTAFLITSTVVVPVTGKLIDMYGRKSLYVIGISIFTAGALLSGLSQTMTQIIIFRGLQGIGAGIMMVNAFTVIGDLFPPAERGKYQGLMSGVFGLSSIIGPPLGGFITDNLSWHWLFYINVPLGIFIIVLFIAFFPNFQPDHLKRQVDYGGVTTLILAVVPAMVALSWGGVDYPWISIPIIAMFAFSAVMGVIFVIIESRVQEPILPLSLFRNRTVVISVLVLFLTGISMFGTIIFVPLFFQGVLGVSATTSGNFMIPMMLGIVVGSFCSGQILSRTGGHYRLQGIVGLTIMALGMALLSRMTVETSYTGAMVNIILAGFGVGATMPLYTIAVQNAVPYEVLGVATSSTVFFRSLGGSMGLAVFGSVMSNRFASDFANGLSPAVKAIISPERLASLAHNPQALVSVQAQAQLKGLFDSFGAQGTALFEQVLQALRHALNSALSEIFLVGLGIIIVAFIVNLFIKEMPLRKQHTVAKPVTPGKTSR